MKQRERKSDVPYLMDKACIGLATSSQRSTAITVKFPILANPRVDINQAYLKKKKKKERKKERKNKWNWKFSKKEGKRILKKLHLGRLSFLFFCYFSLKIFVKKSREDDG